MRYLLNKLKHALSIFVVLLSSLLVVSCSSGPKVTDGQIGIYESNYGFCHESLIHEDTDLSLSNPNFTKPIYFDVLESYYFLIYFKVVTNVVGTNPDILTFSLNFPNSNLLDGNIVLSNAPTTKNRVTDANTGDKSISFTSDIVAERQVGKALGISIALKVKTLTAGDAKIDWSLTAKGTNTIIDSSSGSLYHEKLFTIRQHTLEAPVLTFNSSVLTLSWNHVNKAEYYLLYIDNALFEFEGSKVFYDASNGIIAGQTINWDITVYYITGTHFARLQACHSETANFINSEMSNEVQIII